jgi:hypothetical protein
MAVAQSVYFACGLKATEYFFLICGCESKGGTQGEGIWEQSVEENVWTEGNEMTGR